MKIATSIITPNAHFVKQVQRKKQQRIQRKDLRCDELAPPLKALGRHIAKCQRKKVPVRIPAMRGSEWGHVLRTLELKRALA